MIVQSLFDTIPAFSPSKSSGARYQKVTTTGSSSANGFKGLLKSLANPISVIFSVPFSGPKKGRLTVKTEISEVCNYLKKFLSKVTVISNIMESVITFESKSST